MSDDRALMAALMADAVLNGAPVPPWSPDYGRCVCGARRDEPHTDHSEVVCYEFLGDELRSIATGGPNGRVLWRRTEES